MSKFEYKIVAVTDFTEFRPELDAMGRDGWELVSACPGIGIAGTRLFFKRPIMEPAKTSQAKSFTAKT